MTTPRYLNRRVSVANRVADLLARMSVEDKVGQMLQLDAREDLDDQVLRIGVGSILHTSPERVIRAHELTEQTRLRIPLLIGEDCIHGHSFWEGATIFPTQLGMAASWDPDLLERVARATAVEVAATGVHWTFSPVLCIARDLRWGRVDETFGEDPLLIGELAAAMVKGYQGEGLTDPTAILATAKHFAGYSETQGGRDAIETGLLTEADLDAAVARILRVKFELGLFENPRRPDAERIRSEIGTAEHAELNLEAARRSLVLLRNDGVLPLAGGYVADRDGRASGGDPARRRIAVVGPLADDAQTQLGDWAGGSGQAGWLDGQPREMITTVLDGLRAHTPSGWTITHAPGAEILRRVPNPEGEFFPDGQPRPPLVASAPVDAQAIADAVADAERADYVVAVVGDRIELVGEGRSTATLDLLGGQIALLDALAETGTPLIVVLLASKPLVLPQSALDAAAVLWVANPGMQGGRAIAQLLLGLIEPSGRLPISFARHVGQQPTYYNQIRGQHGDRYADLTQEPAYAFGEGLSYSRVEYHDLHIPEYRLGPTDTVRAEVTLHNTGDRPVTETVQLYLSDKVTSVSWGDSELKGFRQVDLAPGELTVVQLELPVAACSIVDAEGVRVVEPGEFDLRVGRSSRAADQLVATFWVE